MAVAYELKKKYGKRVKKKVTRSGVKVSGTSRESSSQLAPALPLSGLANILLALETVFPMSARDRRLDFLV